MDYQVSIIKDEELIEKRIIEVKDELVIRDILGRKTHRACIDGKWTEPIYTIIVEELEKESYGRRNIQTRFLGEYPISPAVVEC